MNDFTKEELNHMADGLACILNICTINTPELEDELINLGEKIESMIDNYPKCDHRTNRPAFYENGIEYLWCKYCDSKYRLIMKNGECIGYE
jgi:hypothetical protein